MNYKIFDKENEILSFDIEELLRCVNDAYSLFWQINYFEYIDKKGNEFDSSNINMPLKLNFIEFNNFNKNVLQYINCEIIGLDSNEKRKIEINCYDSSYWSVITESKAIVNNITNYFSNVEISH